MAKKKAPARPRRTAHGPWKVKKVIYDRFEEIIRERDARVAATDLEMNGQLKEWGLMAKKTSGVPKNLMAGVSYHRESHNFFIPPPPESTLEPEAPPEPKDKS